jgi:mono/diheme cytochrome c family protein
MSEKEAPSVKAETGIIVNTDDESIAQGKKIFDAKCFFCHKANSTKKGVGPGLKGILKGDKFPVSKMPATPENIAKQLRTPYKSMPSFSSLSEEDILNITAYLNTL